MTAAIPFREKKHIPTYHVISNGLSDGQDADAVLRQLARLFKTTEARVEPLLSQAKILKKLSHANTAQRYQAAFAKAGLDCYVEAVGTATQEHEALGGLDSSWEALSECPQCGFHQPLLERCQNCGTQLHKLKELGQLDSEWQALVACGQCHFMQPQTKICRNCGELV